MGSDFGYLESLLCRIRRLIFIAFLVVSFWFSFSCHGHLVLYDFRFMCFTGVVVPTEEGTETRTICDTNKYELL